MRLVDSIGNCHLGWHMRIDCECLRFATVTPPTRLRCPCGSIRLIDAAGNVEQIRDGAGVDKANWIPASPCANRGTKSREMIGKCCGGRQIVDVFACTVHGDCTYRNTKAGVDKPHPCLGCDDWLAVEHPAQAKDERSDQDH